MDSLTQIVLGAAVAEAVAGKKLGAKAALLGGIAGTIPDLDVFLRAFYDPFDAALVHRGFSHSLLFALIAGPLLAWISTKVDKKNLGFKTWFWLWFLGIVTHPILDMFTNYGTQFLYPFNVRITFNSVFVIDPLYTVPFMILLIGALFMKRDSNRRKIWNWTGIIYSTSYLLIGLIVKLVLLGNSTSYFAESNIKSTNEMVTPMPLTSFYWLMVSEDKTNYYVGYKSFFAEFKPEDVETIPKQHELLEKLSWSDAKKEQIVHITNGYYACEQRNDTLIIYDLRFGTLKPITDGLQEKPLMAYGLKTKDNKVVQTFMMPRGGNGFKDIRFGKYVDRVFGD